MLSGLELPRILLPLLPECWDYELAYLYRDREWVSLFHLPLQTACHSVLQAQARISAFGINAFTALRRPVP